MLLIAYPTIPLTTIPPVVTGQLHSFDLTSTSGTSSGFFRVGLAFEKGDVPAGSIPVATLNDSTPVRSAMLNKNTWSDGSLRTCALVGEVAGGITGTETINVSASTGTQVTSGLNVITALNAIDDLTVEVRNHAGSADNTNVGDLDFSLQTAIGTATRTEVTDDTEVCVRAKVWQQVGNDQHLICENYVDIWLDNAGNVEAVEWAPVLSQHWWVDDPFGVQQTKQARTYDATIKSGSTTLESYTGLDHAYYCRWAGLRTADDAQHGKRLWIDEGTAMPTLKLEYSLDSKKRMMRSGVLPPMKQAISAPYDKTTSTEVYAPTDTYGALGDTPGFGALNHRTAINGPGAYNGRSVITHQDIIALTEQGESDWRVARVSAQAGLAVFMHIRDHRQATGGTDATGKIIPSTFATLGAQSYSGLAAPTVAVSSTLSTLVEVNPVGGSGAFSNWDQAHHVSYSFFMAFAEGEAYLADATLSAADFMHHGSGITIVHYNTLATNSRVLWRADGRSALSNDTYGVLPNSSRQEREWGWGLISMDHAICLLPDADSQLDVIKDSKENYSNWWEDTIDTFGAEQLAKGTLWTRHPPAGKNFMNNISAIGAIRACMLAEDSLVGISEGRDLLLKMPTKAAELGRHYAQADDYHLRHTNSDTTGWTGYQAPEDLLFSQDADVQGATTIRITHRENLAAAVNDTCVFFQTGVGSTGSAANPPPSELTPFQTYHVVSAVAVDSTHTDVEVSATQGGSAISLTDPGANFSVAMERAVDLSTPEGNNGRYIGSPDSFLRIYNATIEYAIGAGVSGLTAQQIADFRAFCAPGSPDGTGVALWNFDGDLLDG